MLSLAEELLLLAFHDEKGSVVFSASTALPYGLSGAIILDLFFREKLRLEDNKIIVSDCSTTGNVILDNTLFIVNNSSKVRDIKFWVKEINSKISDLKKKLLENLVLQGILKEEEQKILWIIPTKRYPTLNPVPESNIRRRIYDIVINGRKHDERTGSLISLVYACDLVNEVFIKEERKTAKIRIKEIAESDSVGKAVSSVVNEITTAIIVASTASTAATAAST